MLTKLFFPHAAGVRVDRLWREENTLHLAVVATRCWARCPLCQRRSRRVHSHYQRTPTDLPCVGDRVVLHLRIRRFVCRVRWCRRRIFAERLPDLVAPFARRTVRLAVHVLRAAFDLGGDPGARHLAAEGIAVSPRTLLRLVRATPLPPVGPVRALSVDDWARRRGRTYGTLLVNLETHTVIDVLPDREAATLAAWLRRHPEVAVVSRDRAGAYAEGIRQGAPQAVQVADRWHLLTNLGDTVERALSRRHRVLREAAAAVLRDEQACHAAPEAAPDLPLTALPAAPLERSTADRVPAQERRRARYEAVQHLYGQGLTIAEVARQLHLTRATVRKQVRAEACPERAARPHLLTPFELYLRHRWAQGCRNAQALFDELRARGYRGSYAHLRHALRAWRDQPARHGRAAWVPTPPPPTLPCARPVSPRQGAGSSCARLRTSTRRTTPSCGTCSSCARTCACSRP